MTRGSRRRGYKLEPDGLPARVGLAVLMSAGIAYAALGPVIVTGLGLSEGFSNETAGYVLSANMYGTAVGGLLVALIVRRLNWRVTAAILLLALVGVDCVSAWIGVG